MLVTWKCIHTSSFVKGDRLAQNHNGPIRQQLRSVQIKSTRILQKPAESYFFTRFELGMDCIIVDFDEEIVMTTYINPGTDILNN